MKIKLFEMADAGNPHKRVGIKCLTFVTAGALASMASAFEWAQDLVVEKGDPVTLGTEYKNSVNTSMTLHDNLTILLDALGSKYYVNALDGTTRTTDEVKIAIGPDSGDDATLEVRLADLSSTVVNSMYANAVIGENGGNGRLWLNHSALYDYANVHVKSFTLSANATTTLNAFDTVQLGFNTQLYAASICNQNVKPMRIIFDGSSGFLASGYLASITAGNGAKLFSLPTASGNVVLVGKNEYAPPTIRSWSGWYWTLFDGTPTANLVFEGPSDVRFEVGVNGSTTINGSNIVWNNTGDLVLYPSGASDGKIATLYTTAANWMPYGSQTGYVCVDKIGTGESGAVKVDLKGNSQRVNGIIVKGNSMITNSSKTVTATMSVGDENGNGLLAGTFTDEKIRWVKSGADGVLVLSNATVHALCVTGGVVRLAPNTVNAIGRLAITNALVETSETATLSVTTWEKGDGVRLGYVLKTIGGVSNEVVTTFPVATDTTLYKEGAYQLYCVTPTNAKGMPVDVRGGTLKMGGEVTANKYWRMTFKKAMAATYTYSWAADGYSKDVNLILGGIGLFSANGFHVLPETMTKTVDGTAASALAQNTAASAKPTYSMNATIYKTLYPQSKRTSDPICGGGDASVGVRASLSVGNDNRRATNMWDVVGSSSSCWFNWPSGTIFANGALDPNDSSTWERIVWRLDDSAKPCTTYALSRFVNNDDKDRPHPTDWMLESSPDGETWQTMDERSGQTFITSPLSAQFNYTYNNHVSYLFAATRANWTFNTFGTVSVAAGATLDLAEIPTNNIAIAGLSIDMTAGAGTINRFVPAQNGTLELTNVQASDLEKKTIPLPVTLTDVSGSALLDTWVAKANGTPIPNSRVVLKNGKLCVKRATGVLLIFW